MSVTTTGSSLKYQWRKNGVDLPQEISAALSLSSITVADAGNYSVKIFIGNDSVVSTPAQVRVLPKSPAGVSAVGRSASSIGVSWLQTDGALWYRVLRSYNSGAFASVCSTSQISAIDTPLVEGGSYSYRVIAGNNDGFSDTSIAFIASTWKGPVITTNLSQTPVTIIDGQPLDLSVIATGTPECTYQWKKNGTDITGASLASYKITPASLADSGSYLVVVTNGVRSINSYQVKIIVLPTYTLNTTVSPLQGGTVTKVKDTLVYVPGTSVKLTARKAEGYRFTGWTSGVDTLSKDTILTVVMSKSLGVQANFIRQYTLTLATTGSGTTTPAGGTIIVDSGAVTQISATAGTGYRFKQWSTANSGVVFGSATVAGTTIKLTQGNATIQAVFKGITFNKILQPTGYSDFSFNYAIPANDSGFLVIGTANSQGVLLKLSPSGNIISSKELYYRATYSSIQSTPNGYILAGTAYYSGLDPYSYIFMSYLRNNLTSAFDRSYGDIYDRQGTVAYPTSDNGFILGGSQQSNSSDLYFLKANAAGDTSWTRSYNPGTHDLLKDCQPTRDGEYIVVGVADMGGNFYAMKLSSNGSILWESDFKSVRNGTYLAWFNSVREVNDGYILAGHESTSTTQYGILLKISSSGDVIWNKSYDNASSFSVVRPINADGYILGGTTTVIGAGESDLYMMKANSSGVSIWTKTFGTALGDENLVSLELVKDGGFLILSSTGMIVKTDENGNVE
jgi:hypothetical protein